MSKTQNIVIFASGTGSNAKKIIEHFNANARITVKLLVSNKPSAPVLQIAQNYHLPTLVLDRKTFYDTGKILDIFKDQGIDLIVLAGFLWLIPPYLVEAYPRQIVNIHPALLPKYGGKGMYGMHVHRAVKAAGEKESGITIHFVDTKYDEGPIIFQARCEVIPTDSPEDIAKKVRTLEHLHFARVIEAVIEEKLKD